MSDTDPRVPPARPPDAAPGGSSAPAPGWVPGPGARPMPTAVGAGATTASSAGGSIYDLGYQPYDGPRLGRGHAVWALYIHGLRLAFGVGRPGRAKVVPVGLTIIAILPALVALGLAALLPRNVEFEPIKPEGYYGLIATVVLLFCAAVAPELVGRDQRSRVLSLYFSRALERLDYLTARLAALLTAMLIMAMTPQILLWVGRALVDPDPFGWMGSHLGELGPILVAGLLIGLLSASVALAISAFTPRRAYATGGIVAYFVILNALASIVVQLGNGEGFSGYALLASPLDLQDGFTQWLFNSPRSELLRMANLSGEVFVGAAVAYIVVVLGILVQRYRTIAA